jgi:hypothetical protein
MTVEALNAFCVGYAKLTELCAQGKKETEEAYVVIRDMNRQWELLDGKEAHYLERFTVKLADMGYYKAPAPPKVDISDLEFDDNVDVKGEFKHAKKIVKIRPDGFAYAAYNYNEHSTPLAELPVELRDEIIMKFAKNVKHGEECLADPEKAIHSTKRRHTSPTLSDAERDW